MIKLTIKLLCLLMVVFAVSCDTKKIETSRQLLAKEKERLNAFLNSVPADTIDGIPNKLTVKELWTVQAVDTVDKSRESGLIYFENETGTGDVVTYGKEVGFRYDKWVIDVDSVGKVGMFWSGDSNYYNSKDANYFVVGAESPGVPEGIHMAVLYMRNNGKSRVVVPSTLGGGRYRTAVFDIEITFLSK